jgi:hypothetical protein
MKLLVLTSEPISAGQLRDAVADADGSDTEDIEVLVVAPALADSGLHFWLSDADDAIARAEEVRKATVEELDRAGVSATSDTGESDPREAVQDALATFPADRIVVFRHPESEQRYREDVDPDDLEDRFGIPVGIATVKS